MYLLKLNKFKFLKKIKQNMNGFWLKNKFDIFAIIEEIL